MKIGKAFAKIDRNSKMPPTVSKVNPIRSSSIQQLFLNAKAFVGKQQELADLSLNNCQRLTTQMGLMEIIITQKAIKDLS